MRHPVTSRGRVLDSNSKVCRVAGAGSVRFFARAGKFVQKNVSSDDCGAARAIFSR